MDDTALTLYWHRTAAWVTLTAALGLIVPTFVAWLAGYPGLITPAAILGALLGAALAFTLRGTRIHEYRTGQSRSL